MTDKTIIEGCKKHQAKYQKMLLEKYSPVLMATAMRYLKDSASAQDALQETWIKVFKNINRYQEEGKLGGWLKRILINTVLRAKIKPTKDVELNATADYITTVRPDIESTLNVNDLMKVIETIPVPAKHVFMMNIIDGMSHREIAEVLNIKESTSRVHLTNARKYLKNILSQSKEMSI